MQAQTDETGLTEGRDPIVAVVIPFYQREAGILRRALVSLCGQTVGGIILQIVIVDDESPIDPEPEIADLDLPTNTVVTLIRQQNAGPAAARNVGLDQAERSSARYVAFLDSDDEWEPEHLATALACLRQGSSFYFCDNIRQAIDGRNEQVGFDYTWPDRSVTPGLIGLPKPKDAYRMPPSAAFSAFLERYLSQTSTVVFDLTKHRGARFDENLRGAGEDHLLWLRLALDSTGVSFSTRPNVVCGLGVNLYFSAIDWSLPATRERFGYMALLYGVVLKAFDLNEKQRSMARSRRHGALSMYGYLAFRNVLRGRLPNGRLVECLFRVAPVSLMALPIFALIIAFKSPERRVAFAANVK